MMVHRATCIASLVLLGGCANSTPARIALRQASLQVLDESPVSLGAQLQTADGKVLSQPELTYAPTPASILSASRDGAVTCHATGDGSVLIAGGGQSATVAVLCRPVARVEAPASLRLVIGRDPEPLPVRAYDSKGTELTDIAIQLTSNQTNVAQIRSGRVAPVGVGESRLIASAGRATAETAVSVVQLIKSEPLVLKDGETMTYTLQQGTYELDLTVQPTDGRTNGVTVSWVGAACPGAAEAQQQHLRCHVGETASLTVTNPSVFGLGAGMQGFINLYRAAS